jgi:hypothetical protein
MPPPITIYKSGPLTSSERSRRKREREAALVTSGDLRGLSDSGLLETLSRTFLRARKTRDGGHAHAVRDLLKEITRRIREVA